MIWSSLKRKFRFKNIKTVTEDFKEIKQRDLDTKSGLCRNSSAGPCRYD